MTKFLPIFPLSSVVYPGQQLNLHVYEPRYIQLITELKESGKTFGIPSVRKEELSEYGTEMQLVEVKEIHPNGEMDIITKGLNTFRIVEVLRHVPDKLYSAAIVYVEENLPYDTEVLNPTLVDLIEKLHKLLGTGFNIYDKFKKPLSFDVVPYVALSAEDQYRILTSPSENGRQWFIIQHLLKLIPTLEDAEAVRAKVEMNGHFRREIPPQF